MQVIIESLSLYLAWWSTPFHTPPTKKTQNSGMYSQASRIISRVNNKQDSV